ncbi:hypothetical protein EJB05_27032, partial [Eragrostis curvula]
MISCGSGRFEVRMREGRAVNIHMFCSRRPGLFPSGAWSIENLGLDVQQSVISCFNGFSLDVFKAEVIYAKKANDFFLRISKPFYFYCSLSGSVAQSRRNKMVQPTAKDSWQRDLH